MNKQLLETKKMLDTYLKINKIVDDIGALDVFPSLEWVWCWDVVRDKFENYEGDMYIPNPKLTEPEVWEMFYKDIEENDFSLEYGAEQLDEAIFDWMVEKNILIEDD